MTHRIFGLLFGLSCIWNIALAYGDPLAITVIDERNAGVYSRVYYDDGTKPPSFLKTDQTGEVVDPPRNCGKMRTLYAHPFDMGAYFDSDAEPCSDKVVLRVLSRQTPQGTAIKSEVIQFTTFDGVPSVLTIKGALLSTSTEPIVDGVSSCEIKLRAVVDQNVFKVEGDDWVPIKQATTEFSNVFADAKQPDTQTVTIPGKCEASKDQVRTLKIDAADRIEKSVTTTAVMRDETFRSLGFDGVEVK